MALANPDEFDVSESQVAAVYLALLIGSNKVFNSTPICGHRILGAIATFTGAGLLPATIVYVALANIEPCQSAHLQTLFGFGIVTAGTAFLIYIPFLCALKIWQIIEEKQRQLTIETTPGWVPRLN